MWCWMVWCCLCHVSVGLGVSVRSSPRLPCGSAVCGGVFPATSAAWPGKCGLGSPARHLGGSCGSSPRWVRIFSFTKHSRMAAMLLTSVASAAVPAPHSGHAGITSRYSMVCSGQWHSVHSGSGHGHALVGLQKPAHRHCRLMAEGCRKPTARTPALQVRGCWHEGGARATVRRRLTAVGPRRELALPAISCRR
jgi:hypothetical protein